VVVEARQRQDRYPDGQRGRLGILGAGHIGPVIARLALGAGYPVDIAASGDPEDIALITELVVPGARPRWASDAAADADIVVLAMPLHRFLDVDPGLLSGKLVVDAMNYWPASDGRLALFEDSLFEDPVSENPVSENPVFENTGFEDGAGTSSSEIVARRLAGSRVVKALNHIGYHDLEDQARPAGAQDRMAAGVAGDDPGAVETVARLVDAIGYDPALVGGLAAGRVLQPGGPVFGVTLSLPEFERVVQEHARSLT
jgi:predicted dinucleotide-binding enzyme